MNDFRYVVKCADIHPWDASGPAADRPFMTLPEAEEIARTRDETHNSALCTEPHKIFQVTFIEIPREGE